MLSADSLPGWRGGRDSTPNDHLCRSCSGARGCGAEATHYLAAATDRNTQRERPHPEPTTATPQPKIFSLLPCQKQVQNAFGTHPTPCNNTKLDLHFSFFINGSEGLHNRVCLATQEPLAFQLGSKVQAAAPPPLTQFQTEESPQKTLSGVESQSLAPPAHLTTPPGAMSTLPPALYLQQIRQAHHD